MTDIAQQRLANQGLVSPSFEAPADVVRWLGAVQAQDYYGAKWAVGQRMREATDDAIEAAFTEGAILRTHVLRPTWHFVAPADIRWMLRLTAPRVNTTIGSYYRKLGLDDTVFRRTNKALTRALRGGRQLTRDALRQAVDRAGVVADGVRFGFILLRAELDGVICSGPREGKQFTYALLDERVPEAPALTRDEALAELTRRYFTSRGPATVQDFVWWSGLTARDARAGVEMVRPRLHQDVIDGKTYWRGATKMRAPRAVRTAYLLPLYDEYPLAYKDRSASIDPERRPPAFLTAGEINSLLVIGGRVAGDWRRTFKGNTVVVTVRPFRPLTTTQLRAVAAAARRYGAFLGMKAEVVFSSRRGRL